MYRTHPVLGQQWPTGGSVCSIYTRTIVLWAINVQIDTQKLWEHVVVLGLDNREVLQNQPVPAQRSTTCSAPPAIRRVPASSPAPGHRAPVVRMISTSTHRRGNLDKRLLRLPFRSVLSLDVEAGGPPLPFRGGPPRGPYGGCMPNLKLSNRARGGDADAPSR